MMFSNETLTSFINHYISSRNSRTCVLVFASSGALPDALKAPIEQFVHRYFIDGFRFVYNGHELTPATITKHGGSLLVAYINSLGNHAVLLASMCQQILQDDKLKSHFYSEAPNGLAVPGRAWETQQAKINNVVSKYVMTNIVNQLVAGKPRFFSH